MSSRSYNIVGSGFTGINTAIKILEKYPEAKINIFEKNVNFIMSGPAYSGDHSHHLLNVKAKDMGIDPKQNYNDFFYWLEQIYPNQYSDSDYVERSLFRQYLHTKLSAYLNKNIYVIQDEIISISENQEYLIGKKENYKNENCIFCLGLNYSIPTDYTNLMNKKNIYIKGMGLSSLDVILFLYRNNFQGKITMFSRHNLLPLNHEKLNPIINFEFDIDQFNFKNELYKINQLRKQNPYTQFILNTLRPHLKIIWNKLTVTEKKQFFRHLKPFWEIFRHRKTEIHEEAINFFIKNNQLARYKTKDINFNLISNNDSIIIDCSGFKDSLRNLELVQNLYKKEIIQIDSLWGVYPTKQRGKIHFLGPINRFYFFENIAVPELRKEIEKFVLEI